MNVEKIIKEIEETIKENEVELDNLEITTAIGIRFQLASLKLQLVDIKLRYGHLGAKNE